MMQSRPGMRRMVPLEEDGRTPELWEDENVDFQLGRVELAFDVDDGPLGLGTLFITTKRVIWVADIVSNSCDFDVPYITMHSVSRDPETYPKPCIYCQLDSEEESDSLAELFLVPEEEVDVMKVFEALSHAALLNPDLDDDGDFEGDDELIYNHEEVNLGAEQARRLGHLESVFRLPGEADEEDGDMHSS
eukprot:gene36826-44672_t